MVPNQVPNQVPVARALNSPMHTEASRTAVTEASRRLVVSKVLLLMNMAPAINRTDNHHSNHLVVGTTTKLDMVGREAPHPAQAMVASRRVATALRKEPPKVAMVLHSKAATVLHSRVAIQGNLGGNHRVATAVAMNRVVCPAVGAGAAAHPWLRVLACSWEGGHQATILRTATKVA